MLIEQLAHANRWRAVSAGAKGTLALSGMVAAFAAATPAAAFAVVLVLVAVTLAGAGIRMSQYLRVAMPALLFLAASCLSLAFSVGAGDHGATLSPTPLGMQQVGAVCARSLGGLAALLFLVLTTPLVDIIGLLRRLKAPEVLLDIMVLCYRTLFVFSECVHDMRTAQAARLGYASPRLAMRSLGELAANLVLQVWQRSQALHLAALARNNDGPLRFLEPAYANAGRDTAIAAAVGAGLIALALAAA